MQKTAYCSQLPLLGWRRITKILLVMKLTIVLLTAASLNIWASGVSQTITLSAKDVSLKKIFSVVELQTGYVAFYKQGILENRKLVSLTVKNLPLNDFLAMALKGQGLKYKISDKTIIISNSIAMPGYSMQQPPEEEPEELFDLIRGTVRTADGGGLAGVSVSIKGHKGSGTVSDENGRYEIQVPKNSILEFSFTGYISQEINTGDKTVIDVVMAPLIKGLDEVVVVGYGTQKRRDITGSVATIPQDRMEMVPNLNIAQAMQGAVPGMMIQQTQAGAAPEQSIMLRGRNSILASNEPLIVVDGVPYSGSIMDINPNDVKSIDVLKDASAAAIYGSRGANGVILVTTKIGQTGKPAISYDGRYGVQDMINVPYFMTGKEFYDFKELREPGKVTASEQTIYDAGEWVNWLGLATRKGSTQQHNLSVSGGFQGTSYFIGGSLLDVKGVAINDGYRRITSRINVETEVTKWLKLGTRTQLSFDERKGHPLDWALVFRKNPLTTAYDDQGNLTLYPWPEFIDIRNPLEPINYTYNNESNQILTNNFAVVKVPFIPGLTYQLNTGIRRRFGSIDNYIGRNTAAGLEARGIGQTNRSVEKHNTVENVFSYNKVIGEHTIFATAGYMYEENQVSANILDANGFPNDFTNYYSASQASFIKPTYEYLKTVLLSQMARLNYSYAGRYLLTLTTRRDGYSGFGAQTKWGNFPSVAVGWNLDSEKFFPWGNQFSKLKLRLSYGLNGNQAVGAYKTISRYAEGNMIAGGNTVPGYVPSVIGLDNLGWESSKTFNFGLDYGVLQNRIEGSINVYKTNTFDLLLERSISSVNGLTSITQNIGETQNTGLEFSINTQNIVTGDVRWTTSGNISFIRNRIQALYGLFDEKGKEIDDALNAWFIGQPVMVNFNYMYDGVWQTDEAAKAAEWGSIPGRAKLRDVNGNDAIDIEDRQVIGQLDPKSTWGLTNTITYKNFTFSAFIHGVHGVTKLNELLSDAGASAEVRRNVMAKNWWTPENPTNDFYMNALNAEKMAGLTAAIYEDASFVRIKDLSLSYDCSPSFLKKTGLGKLRLYAVGRNLVTITKWTGSDPELNWGKGANPLQKEFVFGLTVNL